jgi:hypothetical protein
MDDKRFFLRNDFGFSKAALLVTKQNDNLTVIKITEDDKPWHNFILDKQQIKDLISFLNNDI